MINDLRLDADRAMVLVIDVQEKLMPLIEGRDQIQQTIERLLAGTQIFDLPILATEQYPEGIGHSVESVAAALQRLDAPVLSKSTFSCCGDEAVRNILRQIARPQIILCGIEAHVCVLQTALDLRAMDYQVFVCRDGVGSRRQLDAETGLSRMQQAGAFLATMESILFELCERCDSPQFKQLLPIVKSN